MSKAFIAGAGELKEGNLSPDNIVRAGETGMDAIREKMKFVIGIMQARLSGLQVKWTEVTTVDVYTVHPLHSLLAEELLIPMQGKKRSLEPVDLEAITEWVERLGSGKAKPKGASRKKASAASRKKAQLKKKSVASRKKVRGS